MNRIQKLLFSEYSDFEDMVLIESPFVETERSGLGKKQLQMGLTSTKLILATEFIKTVDSYSVYYWQNRRDPEVETMELISVYPVEYVSLSVFKRRRRRVFKLILHDGEPGRKPWVRYLELGGIDNRRMFWLLWCDKVRYLSPSIQTASATEASVGSSSSATSLAPSYVKRRGNKIWEYYNAPPPSRDPSANLIFPKSAQMCFTEPKLRTIYSHNPERWRTESISVMEPPVRVNRFGEGVNERCSTGLYLPHSSDFTQAIGDDERSPLEQFYDDCVRVWRRKRDGRSQKNASRLLPCADLNHCFGVLSTDPAGSCTMQLRRSRSCVRVTEERNRVRHDLCGLRVGQSLDNITDKAVSYQNNPYDQVLCFWTTNYWYTPDAVLRSTMKGVKPVDSRWRLKALFRRKRKTGVDECKALARFASSLRMDEHVCMWEIDSTALATQLTIIDSALFLKISGKEMWFVKKQGHARNSRNLMTWLIFSHRVACLTASQILILPETNRRARLIARYIMVCDKCHRLGNQQSTMSVLHGLQSPAIYRLYLTWARVRQYHSTAYGLFKSLCKMYSHPGIPEFSIPPYLLCARFYLDTILGRLCLPEKTVSVANSMLHYDGNELGEASATKYSKLLNIKQQIFSMFNIEQCSGSPEMMSQYASLNGDFMSDDPPSLSEISSSASSEGFNTAMDVFRATKAAARKYDLCPNRQAQEFLLKAPYQEHKVNFQQSLSIEPPS